MKTLFISPIDVIFFRDGRSFSAGVDHEAQTLFPPIPSSFYGAIRSAILSQKNAQFSKNGFSVSDDVARQEIGSASSLGTLQVGMFALARNRSGSVEPLLPVPADVLKQKKGGNKQSLISPMPLPSNIKANFPMPSLHFLWSVHSEKEFYESINGFLSLSDFHQYLEGILPSGNQIIELKDIYAKEPRIGIRINRAKKTTGEGQLFSVEFIRLKEEIGFLLSLENANSLSDSGFLRLGGEGKVASYKTVTASLPDFSNIQKKVEEKKKFKLVLMTPAVFQKGWIPDDIDDKTGEGKLFGCKVKLIGASIGRFITAGGWDIAKNCPKSAHRAVPAGSVYFFEILEGEIKDLFSHFGKSILADDWAKQGFGLSYIGAIS